MMGDRSGRTLSKGGEVCTCTTTTSVVRTRYYVWYSGVRMYVHVCDVCMTCSTRVVLVHGTGGTWYRTHTHTHTWCTIILVLEVLEWYNNISFF